MILSELFREAREKKFAVGHFNVSNLEMLRAICEAAREIKPPAVMIGTSEGERDFIGLKQAVALVRVFEEDATARRGGADDGALATEDYGTPLFLNADHSKSVEACRAAIDAGYPSVHFDGSGLPYEENVAKTKEVVVYSKKKLLEVQPPTINGVSVEGELGYLGGGSTVTKEKITVTPEQMTDPQQAKEYVEATAVDRLAIAIGNVHGLNLEEPRLDFERLKAIRATVPESCALVLHAGSGISDEDIKKAIALGIVNIHISTELRKAWRETLEQVFREHPEEYAPYKILQPAVQAVRDVVAKRLRLFSYARANQ